MKLERILVGVDFSAQSADAAEWAARVLGPQAKLVLAYVVEGAEPPITATAYAPPSDTSLSSAFDEAERKLHDLAVRLDSARIRTVVLRGNAAQRLAEAARDHDADVVVVGSHPVRPGLWNWLGSTAESLIGRSSVPVLVASHPSSMTPDHVLAAVDESPLAARVQDWARFLARHFTARATTIGVQAAAVPGHVLVAAGGELETASVVTPAGGEDRAGRGGWIEREFGATFDATPLRGEATFGEPGQEILAAADRHGSGMIVVGRRGAGRVRRALFGSVTREVLRGATCPVLVVTEGEEG